MQKRVPGCCALMTSSRNLSLLFHISAEAKPEMCKTHLAVPAAAKSLQAGSKLRAGVDID